MVDSHLDTKHKLASNNSCAACEIDVRTLAIRSLNHEADHILFLKPKCPSPLVVALDGFFSLRRFQSSPGSLPDPNDQCRALIQKYWKANDDIVQKEDGQVC